MKRFMLILTLLISPVVDAAVGPYYFPGDVGSRWVFNLDGFPATLIVIGEKQIGGHRYTTVLETLPVFGGVLGGDGHPFTTFRKENETIVGYGEVANQEMADALVEGAIKAGLRAEVNFRSSEWVLVKSVRLGDHWTVTSFNLKMWDPAQPDVKVHLLFTIEAAVIRNEKIVTDAGRFDTVVIQYSLLEEAPVLNQKNRTVLTALSFVKDVGLVQVDSPNGFAQITKFIILEPFSVSPKDKIPMTWGQLKAR